MYYLRSGTRMLQDRKNICDSTFTLYNTQLTEKAEITTYAARLVRRAYRNSNFDKMRNNKYTSVFLEQLIEMGFIYEQESYVQKTHAIYLGKRLKHHFPLTALNIELTNMCNLSCRHCYGSFSEVLKPEFVPFEWIKQSLADLNSLHVRKIALTGGEATIHPQFLDIAIFLLEQGFDLCVFTNGYNVSIIKELLEKGKQYNFMIKVSLDGLKEMHDFIRGKKNVYSNALKTIEMISKYDNVRLYISTTVLRENVDTIMELDKMIREKFPNAIHTKDLAFPLGNGNTCAFTVEELPYIYRKLPDLFAYRGIEDGFDKKTNKMKRLRCTGGVSQCTLMPDGNLKICNAACDRQFYFRYNAYTKGLKYAWLHSGKAINKFRHEKAKSTKECKKCLNAKNCEGSNCRVLAWVYEGSAYKSNPLTCFATRKKISDERWFQ